MKNLIKSFPISKKWGIIFISISLLTFSLLIRFYKLENRVWFDQDHSRELLFAWNIVHYRQPMVISMETSGSNIPNLPYYINFLAILMWLSGSNPLTVIYIFVVLASIVVPLLFLWGVVEGSWITGLIAALIYLILPGTIELTNVWGNFLAIIPAVIGIILLRYASKTSSRTHRNSAYILLGIAGALHYSYIGLLLAVLMVELIRIKKIKTLIADALVSFSTLLLLFIPMLIALYLKQALKFPQVRYSVSMCRFCIQKIPDMLYTTFGWLTGEIFRVLNISNQGQILAEIGIFLIIICIVLRKRMSQWAMEIWVVFMFFAWLFSGQIAFWYLFPLVPITCYLLGNIIAIGLGSSRLLFRFVSIMIIGAFVIFCFKSYSIYYDSSSRIQKIFNITNAIRGVVKTLGIDKNAYIEYVFYDPKNYQYQETSVVWLIRQWKYHEILTYNDTLRSYNPALINPQPLYRLYVLLAIKGSYPIFNYPTEWLSDDYKYVKTVELKNEKARIFVFRKQLI